MSTLANRLAHAISVRGISPAELARAVKKTESAVSQWLSGETKSMRGDNLLAVCAFLSCNPQWLSSGIGPMETQNTITSETGFVTASGGASVELPSPNRQKEKLDGLVIPQFNTGGAMGRGLVLRDQPGVIQSLVVSEEWIQKNIKSHSSSANLCIVTGFGDSMKGMFNSGDPLVIDRGIKAVDFDAVYFFRVEDEGFIKRLQRIPGEGIRVLSENQKYDSWTIKPDMDFEVFGRVVKAWQGEDF